MKQIIMITDGKTFGADARRRPRCLSQRLRARVTGDQPHTRRSEPLQEEGHPDQLTIVASDFGLVNFVQKGHRAMPRQGLFSTTPTIWASIC